LAVVQLKATLQLKATGADLELLCDNALRKNCKYLTVGFASGKENTVQWPTFIKSLLFKPHLLIYNYTIWFTIIQKPKYYLLAQEYCCWRRIHLSLYINVIRIFLHTSTIHRFLLIEFFNIVCGIRLCISFFHFHSIKLLWLCKFVFDLIFYNSFFYFNPVDIGGSVKSVWTDCTISSYTLIWLSDIYCSNSNNY
jgi:hypothetical protein